MHIEYDGLEAARQEFNNWNGNAVLFVDFSDNTAWTRVFEIPNYHSESIIAVYSKNDLYGRSDRIGKERLDERIAFIRSLYEKGEERLDLEDEYFLVSRAGRPL